MRHPHGHRSIETAGKTVSEEDAVDREATITGGCMCGAVRYEAAGEPMHVGYCHCRSCRHHSGAALAGMLVYAADKITFTAGPVSLYASSPGIERGFCGRCGTSLSWHGRGLMSLHIGSLDDPDAHAPTLHWRYEERSPWCDARPDLLREKMTFPA